jgi:alanine racemase
VAARLEVDLAALRANYRTITNAAGGVVGAVVKADAYGVGCKAVAQTLQAVGCRHFFVATAAEGAALRNEAPGAAIYVFEGAEAPDVLLDAELVPVINHEAQLAQWLAHRTRPIGVHVDTGMARLGFAEDFPVEILAEFNVQLLMTHLACADTPALAVNADQLRRFESICTRVRGRFPEVATSIGNSAACLDPGGLRDDIARAGIGLYGGNPFADRDNPLRRVARFEGRILQIRQLPAGTDVGYGATLTTRRPTLAATVGFGYADGVPRSLTNRGEMCLQGQRCPIVGRISMDITVIDVTDCARAGIDVQLGDWVECFGDGVTLDEVAELAGTLSYEILTGIGTRVVRTYVGG